MVTGSPGPELLFGNSDDGATSGGEGRLRAAVGGGKLETTGEGEPKLPVSAELLCVAVELEEAVAGVLELS